MTTGLTQAPSAAPAPPPPPARRSLRHRRRAHGRRVVGGTAAVLLAVTLAAVVVNLAAERDSPTRRPAQESVAPPGTAAEQVDTTLLVGTRSGDPAGDAAAVWLALVARTEGGQAGSILYVPPHTAAEIPGRGLRQLGSAYGSGGTPLLLVSTENLLDVEIDHYLELSDHDARALLGTIPPLTVDVPSEVRVGAGPNRARLILTPGLQRLPAEFLTRLLYVVGLEGDDTELATRHLAFWQALTEEFGDDPAALEEAVRRASGALGDSNATVAANADMLGAVVGIADSEMTLGVLPVREVGAGASQLYELDTEASQKLLAEVGSVEAVPEEGNRVQILNGNGVPGIGEQVGRLLVSGGFKVILSGNARKLNHAHTRVITYDPSLEGLERARRVQEILGVGEVQVSPQTQGIVNLTVMVGKDFLRAN
jgi:hypothetical protein